MFKPTRKQIEAVMKGKSYKVFQGGNPYNLNIVGIRKSTATPNRFDDTIVVFYTDESGVDRIHYFSATTDPGLYWLKHPMNINGTAIMCEGQYLGAYKYGFHKGYPALQQVLPIRFARDANRDAVLDFDTALIDEAVIGGNIHRANLAGTSTQVDKWSAGCQVINTGFDDFMALIEKAVNYHGDRFSYTLLNEADFSNHNYRMAG